MDPQLGADPGTRYLSLEACLANCEISSKRPTGQLSA